MAKPALPLTRGPALPIYRRVAMRKAPKQRSALAEEGAQCCPARGLEVKYKQIFRPVAEMGENGVIVLMVDLKIVPPGFSQGVIASIDEAKHRVIMTAKVAHKTVCPGVWAAPRQDEF